MEYQKTCAYCGKPFIAKKANAKTCTSTCRVYYNRKKSREPNNIIERLSNVITGNITALIPESNVKSMGGNVTDPNVILKEKHYIEKKRKDALPFIEDCCYLCGAHIRVSKKADTYKKKIVCDGCIPQYKEWYELKRNVINPDGLDVDEAYQKIQEQKTSDHE